MRAVLVTGGSGFLGRAVVQSLCASGWHVDVLGRSTEADVQADLSVGPPHLPQRYDMVVHAAGKAHVVPRTDPERQAFYDVNARGTAHLLDALDAAGRPDALVLVSTVAVYGVDVGAAIPEDAPLAATEPYGASKLAAERAVAEWGGRHGIRTAVLRLPLVAGPDPPGNLGAMLGALRRGRYLGVGDGAARRSIVRAEDVADIVEAAAKVGGTFNLSDGVHPSFREIEAVLARALGVSAPRRLPASVAAIGGRVGDAVLTLTGWRPPLTSRTLQKMTSTLTLDDARARALLGWAPQPALFDAASWAASTSTP